MQKSKLQLKIQNFLITFYFLFLLLSFAFYLLPSSVFAFDSSRPNNKFGIHLAQPDNDDLKRAAELVDSTSGDWGYVTLVIQENDRDHDKWQNIFDELRSSHLIPIIRLATQPQGAIWKRPAADDAESWTTFLDSLNWVVRDRYIVLFNEPNHGAEWGGKVDAENYASVATNFARKLKERNQNFFIMLAGLDPAAPSRPPLYEDETIFLRKILTSKFQILDFIDGWASHSYPGRNYTGKPWDLGRTSVKTYQWELDYLKALGVNKDLPVFITETGWPHNGRNNYYSQELIGEYLEMVFEQVWLLDEKVRAVTPFILNYQSEPFLDFSWVKPGAKETYSYFETVKNMFKIKGAPQQEEKGSISFSLPKKLLVNSFYHLKIVLSNQGQTIWNKNEGYELKMEGVSQKNYLFTDFYDIRPGQEKEVDLYLRTDSQVGSARTIINLYKKDEAGGSSKVLGEQLISSKTWSFQSEDTPGLRVERRVDFNKNGELDPGDIWAAAAVIIDKISSLI